MYHTHTPSTGAVAHLVVKGAVVAAPRSLALHQRLLHVAGAFSFPGMQGLRDAIMEGVATDFADRCELCVSVSVCVCVCMCVYVRVCM
jgi:hypothetical protein